MKKNVLALVAALIAVSVVVLLQWQQLRKEGAQVAQIRERVTDLQAAQLSQAMAPSAPPAALASPTSMAGAQAMQVQASAPAAAGASEKRGNADPFERINRMMASPEGREMLLGQLRMILPQRYPGLGKELGLTPAQEEKFFDLLARQQADLTSETQRARDSGIQDRAAVEERQRQAQERQRTNQADVAAMLGSKVVQWEEYQKTLPVRRQVSQLQASLGSGSNALTDNQSKPLIQALAVEQARIQEERRNAPRPAGANPQSVREQQLQRTVDNNRRLLGVASSHLNPQQVEGYRRMLEQEENLERTMMRLP